MCKILSMVANELFRFSILNITSRYIKLLSMYCNLEIITRRGDNGDDERRGEGS